MLFYYSISIIIYLQQAEIRRDVIGLFDFFKKKKAVSNKDLASEDVLFFDKLDEQIAKYNELKDFDSKWLLYEEIYAQIVNLESIGKIKRERTKKPISYLKQILVNDGPEFCYVIQFWPIWDKKKNTKSVYA